MDLTRSGPTAPRDRRRHAATARVAGLRLLLASLSLVAAACSSPEGSAADAARVADGSDPDGVCASGSTGHRVGCEYLVTFYPRWFSYQQLRMVPPNAFLGPDTVGPAFQGVVAVNVDTLYATASVDLTRGPVIVTVPTTTTVFSVLTMDQFGQSLPGIPGGAPGVYALTPPGWSGTLPAGATAVALPLERAIMIVRADRYSVTGGDMRDAAAQFRSGLHIATLSRYETDPTSGAATIVADSLFSPSFKVRADQLLTTAPMDFLTQLQSAVRASTTQPLTPDQQSLAAAFDAAFADPADVVEGAVAGYAALLHNYEGHTVAGSSWIRFDDIATWDDTLHDRLDRASITEYLQYGNARESAAYYHAFRDGRGQPLDASASAYQVRFAPGGLPDVGRFWSLTAYTPDAIELVPNSAGTYAVASYTPGLVTDADGSVTITMSTALPSGVPASNWLPVPSGPFNLVLRAYAPQGATLDGSYAPPTLLPAAL